MGVSYLFFALLFIGVLLEKSHTEESSPANEEIPYASPQPSGPVYLAEHFDDVNAFNKKWVKSQARKDNVDEPIAKYDGIWEIGEPTENAIPGDTGLILRSRAAHSAIGAKLDRPFHFSDKPFILQYDVQLQNGQECGGAYLKLLSTDKDLNLKSFHDKTPYTIMFGPDKCGNDQKMHFIFCHKNPLNGSVSEKHARKPAVKFDEIFTDKKPHLCTLIIYPDNTFEVNIDQKPFSKGSLLEDFEPAVNPPEEIDDPNDSKPEDWDEREKISDPTASKPEDWDEDAPEKIPDPNAVMPDGWLEDELLHIPDANAEKPADWDEDMDGVWEAPLISNPKCKDAPGCGPWEAPEVDNPEYRGKWKPPMITNPNYKGKWKPRRIANPDYFLDLHPFKMTPIAAVGIELWSMSDNILFDNIIITDDKAVAAQWAADTFAVKLKKVNKDSESVFNRIINYTNEHPWLWAVYVVVIGLPVVLFIAFCCSSQDKTDEQKLNLSKKTDQPTPDDEPAVEKSSRHRQPKRGATSLPDSEENDEIKEDCETEGSSEEAKLSEEKKETTDSAGGDAPRRRRARKD